MKKTSCLFCAALLFGAVLTACGKKTAKIDLTGWVTDIDAGLEAAKKADKRVILLLAPMRMPPAGLSKTSCWRQRTSLPRRLTAMCL